MIRIQVPEFRCPGCGQECNHIQCPDDNTDLEEGTKIVCNDCGTVLRIVPDGLEPTGEILR